MNIEQLLKNQHQVCLAHTRRIPYTQFTSFLIMLIASMVIAFFIDAGPLYNTRESQTSVILAATPFIFILLVWLQAFFQRSTCYNSDVFITRKGVSIPDLKGQQDYFIKYANIVSITVYYLPLTPLFKFGPYITTHFSLTDILNVSYGVHTFNTKNSELLIAFLKARGVKVKYRIARWPVIYILLFPLFFTLSWLV